MTDIQKNIIGNLNLPEEELYILGAAAYAGSRLNTTKLKHLMELRGYNYAKAKAAWQRFYHQGVVTSSSILDYSAKVREDYQILVSMTVLSEYPKWEKDYDSMVYSHDDFFDQLWELARSIVKGKKSDFRSILAQPWNRISGIVGYLTCLLPYPWAASILLNMEEQSFDSLIANAVSMMMEDDKPNPPLLDSMDKLCKQYYAGRVNAVATRMALVQYYVLGQEPSKDLPVDQYSLAILATQAMYQGKNDEALKQFGKSLKLHNPISKCKNMYANPILCLMLVICYMRCDTPDTRKKLQQLMNKKEMMESKLLMPVALLVDYALNGKVSPFIMSRIYNAIGYDYLPPITLAIFRIVAIYTKMDLNRNKLQKSFIYKLPQSAILKYEFGALSGITPIDNLQLQATFGKQTLLSGITVKEEWETALEDMQALLYKSSDGGKSDTANRIVYFCSDNMSKVTVKEQRRLKSGAWSAGTDVTFSAFKGRNIPSMTDNDKQIAHVVENKCYYSYEICPEMVLPYMVGEDRVYHCTKTGTVPLRITEEPPFVTIEPQGNQLVIGANVEGDKYCNKISEVSVRLVAEDHAVVVKLTSQQIELLTKLLKLGSIPMAAIEKLKPFLELLSKHIEVHSSLIEGGSTLRQMKGQTTIIMRMEPLKEGFQVTPQVQPLKGGSMRLTPGEGKKVVYDEAEGERFQITRNLKSEKHNYNLLAEDGGIDVDIDGSMLDIEEMLDLLEYVQDHPDTYEMEWLEGTKYKVKKVNPSKEVNIGLVSKQNWFDIEGEVELEEGQVFSSAEFLRLMSEGLVGRRFVRLNDGEYVALTEQLTKQLQQLSMLAQYDRKGAHIPRYQVGAIAEALEKSGEMVKTDKGFAQLKKKIQAAAKMKITVPSQLKAELRDYQEEGFRWMVRLTEWGAGACLADDMGLGKTIQTIALMLHRAEQGPALVLCPASVLYNWKSELERFAPSLDVALLSEEDDRKATIDQATKYNVVLSTYGLLVREAELLRQKEWNLVVLDEAHTIKNRSTKMSAAAMDLQSKSRVILTGTPVQNYLSELWNLFQFLNPGLLGTFEHFSNRYILPIERDENKEVQSQLRRAIQPFLLRRTKSEVVEELPDKTEITHLVTLNDAERTAYEALRLSAQEKVEEEKKMGVNVLSMITRLREAACSLSLVSKEWNGGSSKVEAFKDLVNQIVMGGNRVLVFSQFTGFLTQVKAALDEMKMKYYYLDGSTPTRRRADMVKQFQHGDVPIFLISLKAGGLGLNLTGANYVIHLDPWWNPAIEQQATDRAYRIGQHQNVTVYHLVSDHTIEQKILRLHKTKRDMADALLEGTNVGRSMTLEDLKYLVETE